MICKGAGARGELYTTEQKDNQGMRNLADGVTYPQASRKAGSV